MNEKHCDTCKFWEGWTDNLKMKNNVPMPTQPTDGHCSKLNKNTGCHEGSDCPYYEPKSDIGPSNGGTGGFRKAEEISE